MVDVDRLALVATAVSALLFLLLWILQLLDVYFAFDKGYWLLLNAVLVLLIYSAYKDKSSRKVLAICYALAALISFTAFIATAVMGASIPSRNLLVGFKAFGVLLTSILCTKLSYWLLADNQSSSIFSKGLEIANEDGSTYKKDEEKQDVNFRSKCGSCCFPCCSVFMIFLILLAAVHSIFTAAQTIKFYPGDDELVDLGTHSMYAKCSGSGSPPVVLFHGLSSNSLDMSWVQRELEKTAYVCSFDRPGIGQSRERGPLPRTSEQHAKEANELLAAVNITGDFIAVGHSYAGFNMRTYNRDYPGRIKGMVLLDTVNPNNTDACDPNQRYNYNLVFRSLNVFADSGIIRLAAAFGLLDAYAPVGELPSDIQEEYISNLNPHYFQTAIDEFRVWGISCDGVKQLSGEALEFPISVIIAENGIFADELEFGQEQADLSADSNYVLVPDVEHVQILFEEEYSNITSSEALRLIEQYRSTNS